MSPGLTNFIVQTDPKSINPDANPWEINTFMTTPLSSIQDYIPYSYTYAGDLKYSFGYNYLSELKNISAINSSPVLYALSGKGKTNGWRQIKRYKRFSFIIHPKPLPREIFHPKTKIIY